MEVLGGDDVLWRLGNIVTTMCAEDVPPAVAHEVKRRILDTIGIALGGYDEPPSRIAREFALANGAPSEGGAIIIGTGRSTAPETAAFANCVAMHSQDFMDTYLSPSGEACHPADTIMGVLALGEHLASNVDDIIRAIAVAYEVACRLCDAAQIRSRGWDHVTYMGIATACAGAALLGLKGDALHAAISMAAIPSIALRQTRNGEISMWKACAPATAVQHGIRSARLAAIGLRGPKEPFTGVNGFERRVSGLLDRHSLERSSDNDCSILKTHIKNFPIQFNIQAGIEAALAIRNRLNRPLADNPVASITITTSRVCYDLTSDSANKWNPETRETADHSMPYLVVTALRNGEITSHDFEYKAFREEERLSDMAAVKVVVDDNMESDYPNKLSVRVRLVQISGTVYEEQVDYPLGHFRHPMTDEQVESKFRRLASLHVDSSVVDEIANNVWHLDQANGIGRLMSSIVAVPVPQ